LRVLGIDPGTLVTGCGVIDGERGRLVYICDGGIATNKVQSSKFKIQNSKNPSVLPGRLAIIFDSLQQLIRDYRPDVVAVEDIFHSRNARSAMMLGHARGVALLCASQFGLGVFEYTPMEVKKAVVGYGRATKEQVQRMVKTLLKMPTLPAPDASDALAVAICHIHHNCSFKSYDCPYKRQAHP